MPLSPSAYVGYSTIVQYFNFIYITNQFPFVLFSIPVILLPINISNSLKIMLILDCQLFSSLVTALVRLFNLTKSFNYMLYLFSKKLKKTTLYRDHFFLGCRLWGLHSWRRFEVKHADAPTSKNITEKHLRPLHRPYERFPCNLNIAATTEPKPVESRPNMASCPAYRHNSAYRMP